MCKKRACPGVSSCMRIAYLCNRYPAISMTFVRREVQGLRDLGIPVRTMSVRSSLPGHLLSKPDYEAAQSTYAVLPPRWSHILHAHARALSSSPLRYLRTLAFSLRLGSGGTRASLWRVFYFIESIVIWNRCRADRVRHIHAHFANVATDVAMLCVHFADRPSDPWSWSFTLHGPVEFYDVYRAQLSEKIRRARLVICISDFARGQAMAWSQDSEWDKLHVVHCGLDPTEWSSHTTAEPRPPDTEAGRLRVLSVGRLIGLKGHAVLIDAVADLRARGREIEVALVGDGPRRAELEARAQARGVADLFQFAGSVGQDHIRDYFVRADAFCLASFAEGVPVVLMEAMAMELPVVTTRIMGIPELVEDGISGLLTPPGRSDALGALLCALADDPELRRRLGRAGREKVIAEFDAAMSAGRLASVLRDYGVLSDLADTPSLVEPTSPPPSRSAPPLEFTESASPLECQNAGPPPGSAAIGT
jgi:colanic acid/amylovoran biosynthesis glycosyltransferase